MEKIKQYARDHKVALIVVLLLFTPVVGFAFGIVGFVLTVVFGILGWKGAGVVVVFFTIHGLVRAYRWADARSGEVEQKLSRNPFDL